MEAILAPTPSCPTARFKQHQTARPHVTITLLIFNNELCNWIKQFKDFFLNTDFRIGLSSALALCQHQQD
jgi:hypothetical protein